MNIIQYIYKIAENPECEDTLKFYLYKESNVAYPFIISPNGEYIPFNRRALEIRKIFNLTPLEFTKKYNVNADNALLMYGYIFVTDNRIYLSIKDNKLNNTQIILISNYLKNLAPEKVITIINVSIDSKSFQKLNENVLYVGPANKLYSIFQPYTTTTTQYNYYPNYKFIESGNYGNETPSNPISTLVVQNPYTQQTNKNQVKEKGGFWRKMFSSKEDVTFNDEYYGGLPVIEFNGYKYALSTDTSYSKEYNLKFDKPTEGEFYYSVSNYSNITIENLGLSVEDLPKEVLEALNITKNYTGNIYINLI
jgi:hypothetical protein